VFLAAARVFSFASTRVIFAMGMPLETTRISSPRLTSPSKAEKFLFTFDREKDFIVPFEVVSKL
jgi:hypothetical protein